MDWIALVGRLTLAAVFLVAAVSKLADRDGSRQALTDFGVPGAIATPAALALPLVELGIAVLLVPGASAPWGALGALGLLGLFTIGMVVSLARGRKPNCHCFGQLHSAPVGWATLLRNGALAAVAGVVLWRGGESPDLASIAADAGFTAAATVAVVVAIIALALAAIEAWVLLALLPQQGRILVRLEALESALGQGPVDGLAVGQRAPEFKLPSVAGGTLSLAALRSSGKPILLFFTNPACAPCDAVLPDVARWQREHADRVTVAVVSHGSAEANRAKAEQHHLQAVLLQRKREVGEAYEVDSTPSAVLVSADGKIASPIGYGAERIEALLRQAVDGAMPVPAELGPDGTDGHHPPPEPSALQIGEPAPALVLSDLEGNTTDLAQLRGTSTVVLFWSPACGFCQRMLPELKAWERARPVRSPRLLVVSTGTVEANRAMGLASPVVLDADGSAMRRFGASGTPMAVLVDSSGRIASPLAVGAPQVMALARARRNEPARG